MRSARRPELAQRLESVYAMGGALFVPGNVAFGGPSDNEVAEWNIYVDPTAAQAVIDSGLTVRLVSLDGTNQVAGHPGVRGARRGGRRPVRARRSSPSCSPGIRS